VLGWRASLAQVKLLHAGESTGYGRRSSPSDRRGSASFPVGYADGFRRDLTGTEVRVER
jgi:alanine racemase